MGRGSSGGETEGIHKNQTAPEPHSRERGDGGRRGLNLNISSLSCFGPIVIAWRSPLLHRKEWIWHQRSQADNARKSVWLYVNISMCPCFPCSCPRSRSPLLSLRVLEGVAVVVATWWFTCYTSPITHPQTVTVNYSRLIFKWPLLWCSIFKHMAPRGDLMGSFLFLYTLYFWFMRAVLSFSPVKIRLYLSRTTTKTVSTVLVSYKCPLYYNFPC